jgi:hypothetical protein
MSQSDIDKTNTVFDVLWAERNAVIVALPIWEQAIAGGSFTYTQVLGMAAKVVKALNKLPPAKSKETKHGRR